MSLDVFAAETAIPASFMRFLEIYLLRRDKDALLDLLSPSVAGVTTFLNQKSRIIMFITTLGFDLGWWMNAQPPAIRQMLFYWRLGISKKSAWFYWYCCKAHCR